MRTEDQLTHFHISLIKSFLRILAGFLLLAVPDVMVKMFAGLFIASELFGILEELVGEAKSVPGNNNVRNPGKHRNNYYRRKQKQRS